MNPPQLERETGASTRLNLVRLVKNERLANFVSALCCCSKDGWCVVASTVAQPRPRSEGGKITSLITLWKSGQEYEPFLVLRGHESEVSAVEIQLVEETKSLVIASASRFSILIWEVDADAGTARLVLDWARGSSSGEGGEQQASVPLRWAAARAPAAGALALDPGALCCACGLGRVAEVVAARRAGTPLARLEGHRGTVTGVQFCPDANHLLITLSEDKTFRVWDLAARACAWRSPRLAAPGAGPQGGAPARAPLRLAAGPGGLVACGDARGRLWCYRVEAGDARGGGGGGREIHAIDLSSKIQGLKTKQQQAEQYDWCLEQAAAAAVGRPPAGGLVIEDTTAAAAAVAGRATQRAVRKAQRGLSYGDVDVLAEEAEEELASASDCPVLALGLVSPASPGPLPEELSMGGGGGGGLGDGSGGGGGPALLRPAEGRALVATPAHLLEVDLRTGKPRIVDDFTQNDANDSDSILGLISLASLPSSSVMDSDSSLAMAVSAAFNKAAHLLTFNYKQSSSGEASSAAAAALSESLQALSIFPSASRPIPDDSPLRTAALEPKITAPSARYGGAKSARKLRMMGGAAGGRGGTWETPGKTVKGKVQDQPVTFHTRIKSSGYGATPPPRKLGQAPPSSHRRRSGGGGGSGGGGLPAARRPAAGGGRAGAGGAAGGGGYPVACGPLTEWQPQHQLPGREGFGAPTVCGEYSGDAAWLAAGGADGRVRLLRLPPAARRGGGGGGFSVLQGHTGQSSNGGGGGPGGPVATVHWAHGTVASATGAAASADGPSSSGGRGRLLVTAGGDRAVRVWLPGRADPLLELTHERRTFRPGGVRSASAGAEQRGRGEGGAAAAARQNPPFQHAVTAAQFYYLDKFILVSSGSRIFMYKYDISSELCRPKDDLVRHLSTGKYSLAHSWRAPAGRATCLAAANALLSPLVACGGSDRGLHLFDAAAGGALAATIPDAHARPPASLVLPPGAAFDNCAQAACDVILSTAPDGAVHLWDIRSQARAIRFAAHQNRREALSANLSPCMRFVATGSEDKCAYLYDLRSTGEVVAKLKGHTDTVATALFNPCHPQLATAGYDGQLRFYTCSNTGGIRRGVREGM